ncbi:MAG: hypothetical protein FWF84_01200 [Kiritimatiellaeota bacterium]|nr:hypothetical protein [Kiritimatiellota bacterium]
MKRMTLCMVGMMMAVGGVALAQKESVAHRLFSGERQLQAWADELENAQPETLEEAWEVMEVLLRAKRDEAALRLMPQVYALVLADKASERDEARQERPIQPEEWQERYEQAERKRRIGQQQGQVIHLLCQLPAARLKLSLAFFEMFDAVLVPEYGFEDLARSMKRMGWDDGKIVEWLNARCQSALAEEAPWEEMWFYDYQHYVRILWPMSRTAGGWLHYYFGYLRESPRRDEMLLHIMAEARESPDDMKKLAIFLRSYAFYFHGYERPSVTWLAETGERRTPLPPWSIAQSMGDDGRKNETRVAFLQRALAEPLTGEALVTFRKIVVGRSNIQMWGAPPSDELLQAMFRVETMDDLNRVYVALERADDAQRIMLEARALRKEHKLRDGSFLAGMTQAVSGFRVVENEILEREKQDETKPEYWLERARYYSGRKEPKEEEEALWRALALCDGAELSRDSPTYHHYDNSYQGLMHLLLKSERHDEAVALFKAKHAATKHDMRILVQTYWGDSQWLYQNARTELTEDVRHAYTWLKTTPKDESAEYRNAAYSCVTLLSRQSVAALHFGIMDFDNDPFAWDVLAMIDNGWDFGKMVYFLLFPEKLRIAYEYRANGTRPVVDNTQPSGYDHYVDCQLNTNKEAPDEKTIQRLKDCVSRKTIKAGMIREGIYEALKRGATDDETLNWFLLAAIDQAQHDWEKTSVYPLLIANYLATGDWQNAETYIALAEKCGAIPVDELQQAADLAEKAGATEAVRRMRDKIKNLGTLP